MRRRKPGFQGRIMYIHGGSSLPTAPPPAPRQPADRPGQPWRRFGGQGMWFFHCPPLTGRECWGRLISHLHSFQALVSVRCPPASFLYALQLWGPGKHIQKTAGHGSQGPLWVILGLPTSLPTASPWTAPTNQVELLSFVLTFTSSLRSPLPGISSDLCLVSLRAPLGPSSQHHFFLKPSLPIQTGSSLSSLSHLAFWLSLHLLHFKFLCVSFLTFHWELLQVREASQESSLGPGLE